MGAARLAPRESSRHSRAALSFVSSNKRMQLAHASALWNVR
jgi:hypothetical protein